MRVLSVEAIAIEIPLTKNFGGSTYAVRKRCTVITRMRTDAGLVSEVYNGDNREHGREIVRLIHEELAPRVTGLSIFEGERIWETLFALTHATRERKTLVEAIACVDCALWDLRGKARGESVSALLGGSRASLPITAGQSELTHHGVRRLVEARAVDLVNFDASEGGGVTEWRRAALVCGAAGVQMAHHEEPQIAQHLLAAVAHGTYVECFADPERDPVWQAMWANRPPIKDGIMQVAQDPGFGLILDEGLGRRYRVA